MPVEVKFQFAIIIFLMSQGKVVPRVLEAPYNEPTVL